jgi:AmmeMemoRadiSam system protein A
MDQYVELAKKSVRHYFKTRKEFTTERAGVFVSIHQKSGELRGCIGTFLPTLPNVAQEIIRNALAAAFDDPRFPPVEEKELKNLVFSVDVLSQPKKLGAKRFTLDPKRYGLIVSALDGRRGLLLPDIPRVDTAEQQLEICRQKAGIEPEEKIELQTFTVKRHEEK